MYFRAFSTSIHHSYTYKRTQNNYITNQQMYCYLIRWNMSERQQTKRAVQQSALVESGTIVMLMLM